MTEKADVSGEELFLHYAFPCAESLMLSKGRLKTHFNELQNCLANKLRPRRRLLKHFFRNAYLDLRDFAKSRGLPTWSYDTVAEFWRFNHGHEGICAVRRCQVKEVRGAIVVVTEPNNSEATVFNIYGQEVSPGDMVFTHQRMVIEKGEN